MEIKKEKIITAIKKMLDNKETIKAYNKGEVTKQFIKQKGISLEKPI